MKWSYWMKKYTQTHCVARGLRPLTIAAYEASLRQFSEYARMVLGAKPPDEITARDVLEYVQHLREVRGNGDSAVNRHVIILKNFYRAMVAMGYLDTPNNPMIGFPTIKAARKKLPVTFSNDEVQKLLSQPKSDTLLGLRDRAILTLLYGTGIRISECTSLCEADVDLEQFTVSVIGKGGHQRLVPMNNRVVNAIKVYKQHRGSALPQAPFFLTRSGRRMSRSALYERVRSWGARARLTKRVSPHRLRHYIPFRIMSCWSS